MSGRLRRPRGIARSTSFRSAPAGPWLAGAILALVVVLLAAALLMLAMPPAEAGPAPLDALARRALAQVRAGAPAEALRARRAAVNAARELDVFIVGDATRAQLEAAGVRVRHRAGRVTTAWVPEHAIERVAALPGVERIRGAAPMRRLLDVSVPTTGVAAQRGAGPFFAGPNGAGVLIGAVDSGVDYGHPDFDDDSGNTRIVNVWDQTDPIGPGPFTFGYGSQWSSADLDANVARQTDDVGHGTHVLGIAGGDGSGTGGAVAPWTYAGMAPRADLLMVKTDLTDTGVLDGVAYAFERAGALGRPAVVNLSLGSLYGPKDGSSPLEAGVDALSGPGRIVVIAAGNDGDSGYHAEVIAPAGGTAVATLQVSSSFPGAAIGIDGYYDSDRNLAVSVQTPGGFVVGPVSIGNSNTFYPGVFTPAGNVYVENGVYLTEHGDRQVYVELNVPNPNPSALNMTGTWTITLSQPPASSGHDETTENHRQIQWNVSSGSPATPGVPDAGIGGAHLLISEVGMRGLNSATLADSTEFLEIHNPTASTVDLSTYHLADVNAYHTLPVNGSIDIAGSGTDFAVRFPPGATLAPGGTIVVAADGGRYKRNTGVDADYMMFNAGGATTAQPMVDVASNKPGGYPGLGLLTNNAEFVWLFSWDGLSDLVCDTDLVYWGTTTGANVPALKSAGTCQDGPDPDNDASCYVADVGAPIGAMQRGLAVPASGAGTRQRVSPEGSELPSPNGCPTAGPPVGSPAETDLWVYLDDPGATFVTGNQPDQELIGEPGCAAEGITVAAYATKTGWTDCGGRVVSYPGGPVLDDIAAFSSPGPTRDGRPKPDLAAPGFGVASAASRDFAVACPGVESPYLGDGLMHVMDAGTSMAAPHVAGAVALLLQRDPGMTPAEAKAFLAGRATADGFTGGVWNNRWGHGKLHLGDVSDPSVTVTFPNGGESAPPGSELVITWNASDPYLGVTGVNVELSRDDGASWSLLAAAIPDTGGFRWTVTGSATAAARVRVTAFDAAGNAGADASDGTFAISGSVSAGDADAAAFGLRLLGSNPVRGAAELEFALPRAAEAELAVYDLAGRRVATIASGPRAAGRHRARWEAGASAAAGVYFARLRTPGFEGVRRIVVAR